VIDMPFDVSMAISNTPCLTSEQHSMPEENSVLETSTPTLQDSKRVSDGISWTACPNVRDSHRAFLVEIGTSLRQEWSTSAACVKLSSPHISS
jgi:hypothetical protein